MDIKPTSPDLARPDDDAPLRGRTLRARLRSANAVERTVTQALIMAAAALTAAWTAFLIWLAVRLVAA